MPKLLTPQQIAEYLGVRPSTIYQWTRQRFIPHVKLGRLVRFREKTVMEWIARRENSGRGSRKVEVRHLGL